LSQQSRLVDSLRDELNTAMEEKNQTEQRISDNLNELETMKRQYDEVKKSCEVILYFIALYLVENDKSQLSQIHKIEVV